MTADLYYAVDIGGTKIDCGLVEKSGRIVSRTRYSTPKDPQDASKYIREALREMAKEYSGTSAPPHKIIKSAGIGAAGIKGGPGGGTFMPDVSNMPGWENFDLKKSLEDLEIPLRFENDADASVIGAYFHYRKSASRSSLLPFFYITASTGVGGGLIISTPGNEDMLYRGKDSEHPEFGHMRFAGKSSSRKHVMCGCKTEDCFVSYVGGQGIKKRYGVKPEHVSEKIKREVAANFADGLRVIALHYGPSRISLGGGIVHGWGSPFFKKVKERFLASYEKSPLMTPPEISVCVLDDVGLLGAAVVAQGRYK